MKNFFSRHASGLVQIAIWSILASIPVLFWLQEMGDFWELFLGWMIPIGASMVIFYSNYWLFVPRFLFRKKKTAFFLLNTVLILGVVSAFMFFSIEVNSILDGKLLLTVVIAVLVQSVSFGIFVFVAIALRSMQRNKALETEQLRQKEELARMETERLKDQLNPHFIFNSLNNISALVELNPVSACDAISRLSSLIRHVLEQGGTTLVPLGSELDFIGDYINLMRLRYTSSLHVSISFPENSDSMVPPMLFISLVENAFKHGASSCHPSFIDVSLTHEDDKIVFRVENTLLPPDKRQKKLNHGMGLENLRRRLEILYPGSHTFRHGPNDYRQIYEAEIIIPQTNPSHDERDA